MTTLPPAPAHHVSPSTARDCGTAPARNNASRPPSTAIIGESPAFVRCRQLIGRLAPLPMPVLVLGETGSGKEVAARLLHTDGPRARAPFVAINCAAIPDGLAESELFGHVRGAFTGAHRDHAGAFSRADGGTLFLDEVAELPPAVQAKLLRVLELGTVVPVGAEHEKIVHARVVAATHRDLEAMVHDGLFREDLFFRLGVLTVELPALRDRPEDIPPLIRQFAADAATAIGRPVKVSEHAVLAAIGHHWAGNVRELRNAVLRAAVMADGEIQAIDLIPTRRQGTPQLSAP
ncbi:MAG: sigma-54-dependent Fis family transcriptional regulator, partial [Nannocystaceae bacterium]|nr:sigma-54-dependent Fis family transcriptional regulator [Nannocystaceae bacterium]